ncbi:MAG: PilZ domain-containing protein [Desulfuromonadales bacterium]|nr:PilZ domain-containing protein [Desulfuromonadales bacterium]
MNNRHFRRIPFEAEVTLNSGQETWAGELLDVAMKGAMVGTDAPLPISLGTECELCISLPGTPISLEFQAELVHTEESRYGFKFISENLETLTHLRKLIELNTGDAEATRSELSAWLSN